MLKEILSLVAKVLEETKPQTNEFGLKKLALLEDIEKLEMELADEKARRSMFGTVSMDHWSMSKARQISEKIEAKQRTLEQLDKL